MRSLLLGLSFGLLIAWGAPALAGAPSPPFAELRQAYAQRDAARAGQAYTTAARFRADEPGAPQPWLHGRAAIEAQFGRWFAEWSPQDPVDLNFRATGSDRGLYRLAVGGQQVCGRYTVRLAPEAGHWRFASDRSEPVDCAVFHAAPGPLMFEDADTPLDPGFHDALLGRYAGPGACVWRLTRSAWRMQWEDGCTGERQSLDRRSGSLWVGPTGERLRVEADAGALHWRGRRAARLPALEQATQALDFHADDGERLRASLRRPLGPGPWPGVVLLHGSGPQDRHGYAGLMRRLGDALVEAGVAVLAYDKRGGARTGESASFARLGADARAALDALARQPGIDAERLGLAGSSQAGWVAAQALAQGARPAQVLLLMAAGGGVKVSEQVLHHTAQQLQCRGQAVEAVLRQQRAFFALRRDPAQVGQWQRATRELPLFQRGWALPGDDDAPGAWHRVLELDFDPLPVWQAHAGRLGLLLAEHDEATPSRLVAQRLREAAPSAQVRTLTGANHLGLRADNACTPMTEGRRWHADLWPAVRDWAIKLAGRASPGARLFGRRKGSTGPFVSSLSLAGRASPGARLFGRRKGSAGPFVSSLSPCGRAL